MSVRQFLNTEIYIKNMQKHPYPTNLKTSLSDVKTAATAAATPTTAAAAATPTDKLEFRITKVICVDETGRPPFGELGNDEIYLSGIAVNAAVVVVNAAGEPEGKTTKIPAFKVGDFDDGEVKNYSPPKQFVLFNLTEGEYMA